MKQVPVEARFAAAMVSAMLVIAGWYGLPIRFPDADATRFIGVHYLMPFFGLFACGLWVSRYSGAGTRRDIIVGLGCYAVVLLVHFHLKTWAPLINAHNYDAVFWRVDQQFRPLVDAAFLARRTLVPMIAYENNFYLIGFIILFYASFCYHAVFTPAVFRPLVLTAILLQGLGAIGYVLAPAVGPFLYEPGLNPYIGETQHYMMGVRAQVVAGGASWLAAHQGEILLAGLGAMPSLHVGTSFAFLWYAARHGCTLLPLYVPIFIFIALNSVASRWHYLIDLPVGIALALFCIALAHRWTGRASVAEAAEQPPAQPTDLVPVAG